MIRAGAINLTSLTKDPVILHALRAAYAKAVGKTLYFAVGTTAMALPFALGMEWKNVAKISMQRKRDAEVAETSADTSVTQQSNPDGPSQSGAP